MIIWRATVDAGYVRAVENRPPKVLLIAVNALTMKLAAEGRGLPMSTRFIAIDPSTTFTGWAVFQDLGLVAWGKIDARKISYAERFLFIINELKIPIFNYWIREIVIEDVKYAWHSKNRNRNISGLQVVFRSIKDFADKRGFPLTAVNPARWKNAVVGWNRASKQQTKDNILFRFPNLPGNLSEHEYDAIAIGIYYYEIKRLEEMTE